ncbi:recombinase family protein [Salmonella enterica]
MFVFGYLRASASEQDASRAKNALKAFASQHGHRIAGWYIDNVSGTTMNRPELIRLLGDAEPGDVILIEQVDRLTRLDDAGWETLRKQITDKQLAIVSLDLPTSHLALSCAVSDDFTRSMLKAVNSMMLDMLTAIARKDYEDRRRRQARVGRHTGPNRGFGVNHIWAEHEKELARLGYNTISDVARFVRDISQPGAPIYCEFNHPGGKHRTTVLKSALGMVILEPREAPETDSGWIYVV